MSKTRVYLDYAAATPLCKEAYKAMEPFLKPELSGVFGNPASIHTEGLRARDAVEGARKSIARTLEVHSDEIIFTSGGTEGDNLIVKGVIGAAMAKIKNPHVITSSIEHSAILETVSKFEKQGIHITHVTPDEKSPVSLSQIEKVLNENTILISIALVNSELGSVAPVRDIARIIAKFKKKLGRGKHEYPYLHTDAAQAGALLPLLPHNLGVDFLTADAAKFYGPKGVGFIFAAREKLITPTIFGGGQEKGLRPGTQNTIGIVGMEAAFRMVNHEREKEIKRLSKIREEFITGLKKIFPNLNLNGDNYKILPSFVNVCIPSIDGEFTAVKLDVRGVAASAASACRSISGNGSSYVIKAIPKGDECKSSSLRFSFGKFTKESDIRFVLSVLNKLKEGV